MNRPVILTGLRVNSDFTLGNYLGAIKPMVMLANKYAKTHQINMFIPDLHTITVDVDYTGLSNAILSGIKDYVAEGLPIEDQNVNVYRQSYVSAHSELTWIFDCFTGFGEASRMVEFKDKSLKVGEDRVSIGLFNYPILMAADILLYDALWVPVGEDQRQHIELTRTIAQRFNNKFGDIFTVPKNSLEQAKFVGVEAPLRVRSLKNPNNKMSKSISDPAGTILLNDSPKEAAKKIMGATTDDFAIINYNWDKQPGITNLLQIYMSLTDETKEQTLSKWQGKNNYGDFKRELASIVEIFLTNFQQKRNTVDESSLIQKLTISESKMQEQANAKLLLVQKSVGLR